MNVSIAADSGGDADGIYTDVFFVDAVVNSSMFNVTGTPVPVATSGYGYGVMLALIGSSLQALG